MSENQDRRDEGGRSFASKRKRLKSSEPDLSIVCRCDGNEETLHYHSVAMAIHSNYFDSLLASGMEESESKTVTLDGVNPDTFQKAIGILEDPSMALTASPTTIMTVAPLYNRFEFKNGLKLVETILGKYMDDWTKQKGKLPTASEKKLIGDSILFSQEANLETLTQKAISFVKEKLKFSDSAVAHAIFDQQFIQSIAPFLEENRAACLTDFFSELYPNSIQKTLQAADLLVDLYWRIVSGLAVVQLGPLGIQIEGRLTLCRERDPEVVYVLPHSTRASAGRLNDGQEFEAAIGRICNEVARARFYNKSEIGDWAVSIVVRHGCTYRFVCPSSKSFPLPPCGFQWTLVKRGDEDRGNDSRSEATFQIFTIRAS